MELVSELLVSSVAVAFLTGVTVQFAKGFLAKVSEEKRGTVTNLLALAVGIAWAFAIAAVEGVISDAPSIIVIIMRGFVGGALSVFGYEFVANLAAFARPAEIKDPSEDGLA